MIVTRNKRATKGGRRKVKTDAVGQYASDAWSLAKRTAVGLNEIRKLINIETKFVDKAQTSTAISTTATVFAISQTAQGLDVSNRVGDSIKLQHITVRGRVNVSTAASNSLVRIMVIRDLDGYGTAPVSADILQDSATVSSCLSPINYLNRERFSVLYDELVELQGIVQGTAGMPFYFDSAHAGHVLYLGTTATAASNGKGSLYVVALSDEATNTPSIAFYSRVTYTDD